MKAVWVNFHRLGCEGQGEGKDLKVTQQHDGEAENLDATGQHEGAAKDLKTTRQREGKGGDVNFILDNVWDKGGTI